MKRSLGFTLVELMIVLTVLSILAAIAIVAYQDSVAKAQAAEGFSLATGARTAMTIHFSQTGQYPADNASAGLAPPASISGRYVQSVTVNPAGRIDVLFSANASSRLAGESLFLTATPAGDGILWTCSASTNRVMPSSCR
ncbi:MAG: pilin [Arenimonas sp.]|uniref:pilin n=1 Tax=Arenimonas sp. TaxID=1872635 RepID=UPI0025BB1512|nr:pilin [Arenimonas sp.]MBW8369345.1 pilin [Arenimonas sp.]